MQDSYKYLAGVYDALRYDVDVPAWQAYVAALLEKGGVLPPARVLEAACGTGAVTAGLAQGGYAVTAFDREPEILACAREKLRMSALPAELLLGDMRDFRLPSPAAAVVCACDGVNYLAEDGDAAEFFRRCRENLLPGGLLLFDISSAGKLTKTIGNNVFVDDGDEVTLLWQNTLEDDRVQMDCTLFLQEGEGYRRLDERHVQRIYTIAEVADLLKGAGFTDVKALAFPTFEPANDDLERIQFTARKTKEHLWTV
jgi:SAM-dependent methyltransferase